jgi:farnesyl diphosphate synthase
MLAEVGTTVLGDAIAQVQADIDSLFDALLPVPDDTSARLVEAMRYAAIGGGKRVRPLLVVSTASLFGVAREPALRAGAARWVWAKSSSPAWSRPPRKRLSMWWT